MLRKLLKYDLMAVWKGGWGTLPVIAACTAGATVSAQLLNSDSNSYFSSAPVRTAALIALIICVFGIAGCGVIIGNLVFVRYNNNFFTDEGYLTFTLPVKRNSLLLSKTLSALISFFAYFTICVVCLLIFFVLGGFDFNVFKEIGYIINKVYLDRGVMGYFYLSVQFLIFINWMFLVINIVQFAITVGNSIAKKAKIIVSIGVAYIVLVAIFFIIPDIDTIMSFGERPLSDNLGCAVSLIIYLLTNFTLGLVLYLVTLDRISRKLNLD